MFASIKRLQQIPKIAEEVTSFFTEQTEAINDNIFSIQALADMHGVTEKSALNFAQGIRDGSIQLKDGQTMLQGYQSYIQSTGKAAQFADLKTKALSASMKVFSTIGWMAINKHRNRSILKVYLYLCAY